MQKSTIAQAQTIERAYGSNYYLATLFLPSEIKEAVFVLYAFVRIPDEMVDNPKSDTDPEKELHAWHANWKRCYYDGDQSNEIMVAAKEVFLQYNIPFSYSEEFIAAMIQDLHVGRYQTYQDLQKYMRGSAEVVGLMLVYIFGCTNQKAVGPAEKLGEAMQLTNFLRDVGEDYQERNRIYLPLEDMEVLSVSEKTIASQTVTPEFQALLKKYIAHARVLFAEANEGISLLPKETQRAVRLASKFYEGILDRIEDNNYDVLTQKARHSKWQKCRILLSTYVR